MANAEKPQKKNIFVRIGLFFKNLVFRIIGAFKDMFSELKKVSWPTKQELINYSLVVLGFMAVMGIIIGLLDAGAAWLVSLIIA